MGGIVVLVFLAFAFVLLFSAIKIVPQGREFTVERFGRYTRTLKPGISILTPFFETVGRKVNMMEQVLEVPQQEVITKDNVSVKVDAIVFIQVMDAAAAAYRVDNLIYAITQLAQTNLRTVVGSLELDEVLSQRDQINTRLLSTIDHATGPWGVKVARIEIKDLSPPADITNAMARQMKAERERRAVITEAEAKATTAVSEAIAKGDVNAINYFVAQKYVEAFGELARSPQQKTVIVPADFAGLTGTVAGVGELIKSLGADAPRPAPPARGSTSAPAGGKRGE